MAGAPVRVVRLRIAEADTAAGDLQSLVGADEDDGGEVVGHQPLDADQHLLHHLVGIERLRHRARRVAQGLGVSPLLPLLRLHADTVVDLAAQALDGPFEVTCALLDALVEVLEGAVEPLLGRPPLGDVLERAEDADDLTVEIAQRHLLGLDPAQITARAAQPLDDPDHRLTGLGDVGVPIHEPIGAELGVVGPRHVPIGLPDQIVGFGPGESREHAVAAEVPRLAVLPEHRVGRGVHQHLEQLLARLQRVVAAHPTLQQGGVEVDVRADVRLGGHVSHRQPVSPSTRSSTATSSLCEWVNPRARSACTVLSERKATM